MFFEPITAASIALVLAATGANGVKTIGPNFQVHGSPHDFNNDGTRVVFDHLGTAHAASGSAFIRTYVDTQAFVEPIEKICRSIAELNNAFDRQEEGIPRIPSLRSGIVHVGHPPARLR